METKEYKLLDGRTIRAKYDKLGMCKISENNLELFVKEFNASYRQAKILETIKKNYALMKLDECKKGKWIKVTETDFGIGYKCSECGRFILTESVDGKKLKDYPYCHCGAKMEVEENDKEESGNNEKK